VRVFVTGGSGFIGSHLVNELKRENDVVVLVRDIPSPLSTWGKWISDVLQGCTIVLGDVLNSRLLRRVLAEYHVEYVYHLAAQAVVSTALKDPFGTFQTNILGTVNVLEACRQVGADKVLVMSTDKVYGNRMKAVEKDPLVSAGIYETSKACQDLVAQAFQEAYDMDVLIARACNCYGFDFAPRIVSNTVRACLRGETPIIFEGEKTLRQYIYVVDLCDALIHLMKHAPYKGVYNIATPDIMSQEQVVRTILKFFPNLKPKYTKREPVKEIQSQSMVSSQFGWKPKYSFEEGIKETIERFRKWVSQMGMVS